MVIHNRYLWTRVRSNISRHFISITIIVIALLYVKQTSKASTVNHCTRTSRLSLVTSVELTGRTLCRTIPLAMCSYFRSRTRKTAMLCQIRERTCWAMVLHMWVVVVLRCRLKLSWWKLQRRTLFHSRKFRAKFCEKNLTSEVCFLHAGFDATRIFKHNLC